MALIFEGNLSLNLRDVRIILFNQLFDPYLFTFIQLILKINYMLSPSLLYLVNILAFRNYLTVIFDS